MNYHYGVGDGLQLVSDRHHHITKEGETK